jgi:heptosyltransferase-2
MTSLVVQTSFIGDMVLTTPLIAELARRGPVDVLATPITGPLLANNPAVRRVILYDKRGEDREPVGLWRAARSMRELFDEGRKRPISYEAVYLAQGSIRSAIVARMVGAQEYVGFSTSAGRALYTQVIGYREEKHHAERLWSLSQWKSRGTQAPPGVRPTLYPGTEERAAVDAILGHVGTCSPGTGSHQSLVTSHQSLVVLAPGSTWATKRWPYFAELARILARSFRLAIVGSEADQDAARSIRNEAAVEILDATGELSLLGSAELIGRAAALVTNDSAPLHLASAMNTPTVAVFGPTVPAFGFGPLSSRSAVAGVDALACRPCHRHGPRRCPLGHWRCMRDLSPEHVAQLVEDVITDTQAASSQQPRVTSQ